MPRGLALLLASLLSDHTVILAIRSFHGPANIPLASDGMRNVRRSQTARGRDITIDAHADSIYIITPSGHSVNSHNGSPDCKTAHGLGLTIYIYMRVVMAVATV